MWLEVAAAGDLTPRQLRAYALIAFAQEARHRADRGGAGCRSGTKSAAAGTGAPPGAAVQRAAVDHERADIRRAEAGVPASGAGEQRFVARKIAREAGRRLRQGMTPERLRHRLNRPVRRRDALRHPRPGPVAARGGAAATGGAGTWTARPGRCGQPAAGATCASRSSPTVPRPGNVPGASSRACAPSTESVTAQSVP